MYIAFGESCRLLSEVEKSWGVSHKEWNRLMRALRGNTPGMGSQRGDRPRRGRSRSPVPPRHWRRVSRMSKRLRPKVVHQGHLPSLILLRARPLQFGLTWAENPGWCETLQHEENSGKSSTQSRATSACMQPWPSKVRAVVQVPAVRELCSHTVAAAQCRRRSVSPMRRRLLTD